MLGLEGARSLREQLEEAIDEHEGENGLAASEDSSGARGDLSRAERQMLRNLLHFSEHDADDVAVPRGEIIAVDAAISWEQMVAAFSEHGHSRMPVYRETLDDVIGMMHIKDIFPFLANGTPPPADWTTLMRQPLYVPQARGALDVLADMRAKRVHLAIVVDEFSGTDGLITIEDLVEEIVGEIEDEHDDAPEEMLRRIDELTWDADARAGLRRVHPGGSVGAGADRIGGQPASLTRRDKKPAEVAAPAPAPAPEPVAAAPAPAPAPAMATGPLVDEKDTQAAALGYVAVAAKADKAKVPKYADGQACSNCSLYQGGTADQGGCPLFPGKQVLANAWCSGYVKKTA
jgi:Mg2+/Co2+ transporter CorC